MTDHWIAPDRLFDGERLHRDCALQVRDGQVLALGPATPDMPALAGCVTPGFVDLQVNGGGGVLLNTTPTAAGIAAVAAAHRQFGTVALMPTVITDAPEILENAAEAALAAKGHDSVIGLHIEGPHIAVARRGTHQAAHIRHMDHRTIAVLERLRAADVPVLITLAPEAASTDQIATLAAMGAVVSIGHTDAAAEAVKDAIAAGAACATHLFNAMSPMTSRAPGAVGAIINSTVPAGLICDGHHVDDSMIALALRARPGDDLMFLVSDAMATVGGPDHFTLYGDKITLADGKLINAEGNLAGAHMTQRMGVARLVHHVGVPLETALRMAITVPAKVIGQPKLAQLVGRRVRDVVVLPDDLGGAEMLDTAYLGLTAGSDA